jgi:hypothetical protein
MSIEKSDIKISVAHEIGCRLDDALESINKDLYRLEGASSVYRHIIQVLHELNVIVDSDHVEEKIDIDSFNAVKKYFEKAIVVIKQQSMQAENNKHIQLGKIQSMQSAIHITKCLKDEEETKSKLSAAREKDRLLGIRPQTVKDRRAEKEASKKK